MLRVTELLSTEVLVVTVARIKVQQTACLRAQKMHCGQFVAYHIVLCEDEMLYTDPCF